MIDYFVQLDGNILIWLQNEIRNPILNDAFSLITALGNKGFIWILLSTILLIPRKTRKIGFICLISLLLSLIVNNGILKNLIHRIRPYERINDLTVFIPLPTDYSFPSGHTGSSFACAWVMFLKLPKKYGVPALILASLISFSRLYLGVHYPTDVIAGAIIGILLAYAADFLVSTIQTRNAI